jgi:hypothetical protein
MYCNVPNSDVILSTWEPQIQEREKKNSIWFTAEYGYRPGGDKVNEDTMEGWCIQTIKVSSTEERWRRRKRNRSGAAEPKSIYRSGIKLRATQVDAEEPR